MLIEEILSITCFLTVDSIFPVLKNLVATQQNSDSMKTIQSINDYHQTSCRICGKEPFENISP